MLKLNVEHFQKVLEMEETLDGKLKVVYQNMRHTNIDVQTFQDIIKYIFKEEAEQNG